MHLLDTSKAGARLATENRKAVSESAMAGLSASPCQALLSFVLVYLCWKGITNAVTRVVLGREAKSLIAEHAMGSAV